MGFIVKFSFSELISYDLLLENIHTEKSNCETPLILKTCFLKNSQCSTLVTTLGRIRFGRSYLDRHADTVLVILMRTGDRVPLQFRRLEWSSLFFHFSKKNSG